MFRLFEIKEGKFNTLPDVNAKSIKGSIIVAVIVMVIVSLSGWLKIDEKQLWKVYNDIIQHLGLKENLPDIKNNERKLEADIEVEVDRAIREYERLTGDTGTPRIPLSRLIEMAPDKALCYSEECRKLGGEMRLCSPWSDDCPKN